MRHDIRLQGRAFALRPVELGDAAFMVELRSDPKLARYLNPTSPKVEEQEAYLRTYFARSGDYYFIVERLAPRRREGMAAIYDLDQKARTAEWGRWILRAASMAAAESALLVYRAAFEVLGLETVYCRTVAANERVISFHESSGMTDKTRLPGYFQRSGEATDSIEQCMTRELWTRCEPMLAEHADKAAKMLERAREKPRGA